MNLRNCISFRDAPAPSATGPFRYWGFTITLRHTTLGRTPLDKWSALRIDLYLTTHNTHDRQRSVFLTGFDPAVPASERPQTHALDHAAASIGERKYILKWNYVWNISNKYRHKIVWNFESARVCRVRTGSCESVCVAVWNSSVSTLSENSHSAIYNRVSRYKTLLHQEHSHIRVWLLQNVNKTAPWNGTFCSSTPPSPSTGPNSRCVNSSSSRREWWNLFTRSKFNQTAW